MTFEKWFESYAPTAPESLDDCALAAFRAGAASRDAEIAALKTTPAHMRQDLHCVVSDIAQQVRDAEKENDQLREQVRMLREALLTCSAGDFSTGHVIYPSFDEKLVEEALAATEPKIAKPS